MKYLRLKYLFSMFRMVNLKIRNYTRLSLDGLKFFFGKSVKFSVSKGGKIVLKGKDYFSDYCTISCEGGVISVGYNTFFNENCKIVSLGKIDIGENCLFGPNVCIYDHNHRFDRNDIPICKQGFNIRGITIGDDVWIGANVVITAGVKIGNRVVVGANSLISRDLECDGVYAGNPAKLIKKL